MVAVSEVKHFVRSRKLSTLASTNKKGPPRTVGATNRSQGKSVSPHVHLLFFDEGGTRKNHAARKTWFTAQSEQQQKQQPKTPRAAETSDRPTDGRAAPPYPTHLQLVLAGHDGLGGLVVRQQGECRRQQPRPPRAPDHLAEYNAVRRLLQPLAVEAADLNRAGRGAGMSGARLTSV